MRVERRSPPLAAAPDPGERPCVPGPGSWFCLLGSGGRWCVPGPGNRCRSEAWSGPGGKQCLSSGGRGVGEIHLPLPVVYSGLSSLASVQHTGEDRQLSPLTRCQSPPEAPRHSRTVAKQLSLSRPTGITPASPQAAGSSAALPLPVPGGGAAFLGTLSCCSWCSVRLQMCKHFRAKFLDRDLPGQRLCVLMTLILF